ncbi:MAG: GNAT family protein [Candidatus Paceibacterota bacterium]
MKFITPILHKEQTGLAKFCDDVTQLFLRWMNNPAVYRFLGDREITFYSIRDAQNHVMAIEKESLLIVAKEEDVWIPIGYICLNLRPRHKIANFTIVIGEEKFRDKGHGKTATSLTLTYAFKQLGLFAVHLVVSKNNQNAIAVYEKTGFKVCGIRHGARMEDGERTDEILMECTQDMYYNRRR